MISKRFRLILFFLGLIFLAGCAGKAPHMLVPDYGKKGTRLVAVLPVRNLESDAGTASVLRAKLIEELYRQIGQMKVDLDWLKKKAGIKP